MSENATVRSRTFAAGRCALCLAARSAIWRRIAVLPLPFSPKTMEVEGRDRSVLNAVLADVAADVRRILAGETPWR